MELVINIYEVPYYFQLQAISIELAYVADHENSVPIWEAIKARHPAVA